MTRSRDDLRYWYEMGYFYGRNDALDGRPYDARLPDAREDCAKGESPNFPPSSSGAIRQQA